MESTSSSSSSSESEDYSTDTDCSCSSQSSNDDPSFNLGFCGPKKEQKSQQGSLANKRNSSVDFKQKEHTPVASNSTQLQSELENIIKREIEEMEVEHNGLTDSAQQRIGEDCLSSAAGEQAEVTGSKRKRVSSKVKGSEDATQQSQQPPSKQSSKKVGVSNPHEKYLEGSLVMARGTHYCSGYPYWPGIIRRPDLDLPKHRNYYRNSHGMTWFFIQFFSNPTIVGWQIPGDMRLFNAAEPNRCNIPNPEVVARFEEGIRIAKVAINFSVEYRLAMFTLRRSTPTTSLLKALDDWNSQPAPGNGSVVQLENIPTQGNGRICSDSVAHEEGEPAPRTNANGESGSELLAQNEIAPASLAKETGESCYSSVEIMKKRISDYQQKLRDECNREKDEEIKRLTTDIEKLAATVKEQANMIAELQEQREKEKQEKLNYKEELENMKGVFEEMFSGCGTK